MGKKNVAGRVRNGMFLTVTVITMFAASSCKKEASIAPENAVNTSSSQLKTPAGAAAVYKPSQPISLSGAHDITISGYAINGGAASCIDLANCYNIHITGCRLQNSDKMGINLAKCNNIIIDNCSMVNVQDGVHSELSHAIQVHDNKMANLAAGGTTVLFYNEDSDENEIHSNSAVSNQLQ